MDLSYSDEQKQIKEGVERFVREQYAFETRRKIAATERGWLPENWAKFAELGWLGMSFSEADGGFGGGMVETAILMEAFGSGLVLEPYLPTVVMGGGLGERLGAAWLKRIEKAARRHTFFRRPPAYRLAELGDMGGAIGASLLASGTVRDGSEARESAWLG